MVDMVDKSASGKAVQGSRQISLYAEGSKGSKTEKTEKESAFVMKLKAKEMKKTTSQSHEVWYVNFGASNHMTSHEEWFLYLEKLEQLGVVKTKDDTPHPIEHVGEVPLSHVGQKGKLMNVLHVPDNSKEPYVGRPNR
mgnify:CR=1 FL=1